MTQLLEHAFQQVSKLPPVQQDAVAKWLLEELSADQKWDALFASSQETLASLADDALMAHRAGETKPLDTDLL